MAYVPPARRGLKENVPPATTKNENLPPEHATSWGDNLRAESDVFTADDILAYFWPVESRLPKKEPTANDASLMHEAEPPTEQATQPPQRVPPVARSTINSSVETPNQLAFVLLHIDANPFFHDRGLIFVKTNLHLVKGHQGGPSNPNDHDNDSPGNANKVQAPAGTSSGHAELDDSHSSTALVNIPERHDSHGHITPVLIVPVFEQIRAGRHKGNDLFRFIGYHKLDEVKICESKTKELRELLELKWTRTDRRYGHQYQVRRDGEQWKRSFSCDWAQLKLVKDEEYGKVHGPPAIKKSDAAEEKKGKAKGVTEMLQEMRLREANTQ